MLIDSASERMLVAVTVAACSGSFVAIANADPWGEESDPCRSGA